MDLEEGLRALNRRNLELEALARRLLPRRISRRRGLDLTDLSRRRDAVEETRLRGARLRNYFKN